MAGALGDGHPFEQGYFGFYDQCSWLFSSSMEIRRRGEPSCLQVEVANLCVHSLAQPDGALPFPLAHSNFPLPLQPRIQRVSQSHIHHHKKPPLHSIRTGLASCNTTRRIVHQ